MRKLIIAVSLCLLPSIAFAWNPFKGMIEAKVADEVNAVKNQVQGDMNGIKADIKKLADVQVKLNTKINAQNTAIAGFNNTVSKVSSEIKASAGRDNTVNDSQLMKDYIQALKDAHTELVGVMWKIVYLLVIQLVGIIGAFGGYMFFTIKSLLYARDKDDAEENELIEKLSDKDIKNG
jgi:hypothetical protein